METGTHKPLRLNPVNPLDIGNWDEMVLQSPQYSFFLSQGWARALTEAYSYKPLYFADFEKDRLSRLFAVMGVESFLTGKRGVSLPFSDYCRPILGCPGDDAVGGFRDIVETAVDWGKKAGWKYLEIRDGLNFPAQSDPYCYFYRHKLDLDAGEEPLFRQLHGSTKRNIKKAAREGLEISFETSMDSVLSYYRLHGMLRKRHGLPSQPLYFFKSIHKNVIDAGKGFIVLASFRGRPVSGAVFFWFGEKAVYKYGASDFAYQNMRGNDLVMWEAIRSLAGNGFKSLCFGRTDPDNDGLRRFKAGWGAKETVVRYFRIDLKNDRLVAENKTAGGLPKKIISRMPVPALNFIGRLLYRHVG